MDMRAHLIRYVSADASCVPSFKKDSSRSHALHAIPTPGCMRRFEDTKTPAERRYHRPITWACVVLSVIHLPFSSYSYSPPLRI
jgi:hypothetical protein